MKKYDSIAAVREQMLQIQDLTARVRYVFDAVFYLYNHQPREALALGEEVLQWFDPKEMPNLAADVYFELGRGYGFAGMPQEGFRFLEKAKLIFEKTNKLNKLAKTNIALSTLIWGRGDYDAAMPLMYEGLGQAEQSGDKRAEGWGHVFLGGFYYDLRAYDQAQFHYEKALPLIIPDAELEVQTRLLGGLCVVYIELGRYDKARYFAEQGLDICQRHELTYSYARVLNDLGTIHKREKNYAAAKKNYLESLEIRRSRNKQATITTLIELGELTLLSQDYREAETYLNEAQHLAEEIEAKSKLARIHLIFSELREKTNDYKAALSHHRAFVALRVKTVGDELQMKVNGLQSQLALERQTNEAQIERLQNVEIKRKNKAITDSINYASRIQQAILPELQTIQAQLPKTFIFFQPRDIVSGDFYWFWQHPTRQRTLLIAADSTGHGVPGAFMSLIGDALLRQIVQQQPDILPHQLLQELHQGIRRALRQNQTQNKDGMDMSVCLIDAKDKKLHFAGAKNPLIYFKNKQLYEIKGDRMSIGGSEKGQIRNFTLHTRSLQEIDNLYLASDGFQDQFGGEKGEKLMRKGFRQILTQIAPLPIQEQQQALQKAFEDWKGTEKQLDDVLVIGWQPW